MNEPTDKSKVTEKPMSSLVSLEHGGLESLALAELDLSITTAKNYPRDEEAFLQRTMQMACCDPDTAASMFYVVPRDNKRIRGPSVRMAEIAVLNWKNIRIGARIISETPRFVTAQAVCKDLENNNESSIEVRRRITYKNGDTFSDDLIGLTANAACSIGYRQVALKVIPMFFIDQVYKKARLVALGHPDDLPDKLAKIVDYFGELGVPPENIYRLVKRSSIDALNLEDVLLLRQVAQAVRDYDTTVEDAFGLAKGGGKGGVRKSQFHDGQPDEDIQAGGATDGATVSTSKPPRKMSLKTISAKLDDCNTTAEIADLINPLAEDKRYDGESKQIDSLAKKRMAEVSEPESHQPGDQDGEGQETTVEGDQGVAQTNFVEDGDQEEPDDQWSRGQKLRPAN